MTDREYTVEITDFNAFVEWAVTEGHAGRQDYFNLLLPNMPALRARAKFQGELMNRIPGVRVTERVSYTEGSTVRA